MFAQPPGQQIVGRHHPIALAQQPIAQMRSQKACSSSHQRTSRVRIACSWVAYSRFQARSFFFGRVPAATPPSTPPDAPHCNKRIRAPPSPPDHTDSAHPARSDTSPACADAPDQAPRTLPTPSGSAAHPRPSPPHTHPTRTRRPISAPLSRAPSPPDRKRKRGSPRAAVPAPAASPEIPEYRRSRP